MRKQIYNQKIDWESVKKHYKKVFPKIKSNLEKALAFLENTELVFDGLETLYPNLRLAVKRIGGREDCQKELEDNEFKITTIIGGIVSKYKVTYNLVSDICYDDYNGLFYGRFFFKPNYQDFVKQK